MWSTLTVQWLWFQLPNSRGEGLIPGQGSKIPHISWPKNQNKKQKQYGNKLNKDSKNGPQQNKIFKLVEEILKAKQRDHKIKKKKKKTYKILSQSNLWTILSIFQVSLWQFQMRVSNSRFDLHSQCTIHITIYIVYIQYTMYNIHCQEKLVCFLCPHCCYHDAARLLCLPDNLVLTMCELSHSVWHGTTDARPL